MPLPGTRVIHPRWSQHHRPTATGGLTGTCDVTRRGTGKGVMDPDTGVVTPPARVTIASGVPCRVQAVTQTAGDRTVAGDEVTQREYLVSLQWDTAAVEVDDWVTITAARDAQLSGRSLRVIDVLHGTEQWQRDLHCLDDLTP
jgi:hypothetical protein